MHSPTCMHSHTWACTCAFSYMHQHIVLPLCAHSCTHTTIRCLHAFPQTWTHSHVCASTLSPTHTCTHMWTHIHSSTSLGTFSHVYTFPTVFTLPHLCMLLCMPPVSTHIHLAHSLTHMYMHTYLCKPLHMPPALCTLSGSPWRKHRAGMAQVLAASSVLCVLIPKR